MAGFEFDLDAYLARIGLKCRPATTLAGLQALVAAHSATIPYENVDVLLGRAPKLDLAALQAKMVRGQRGGYCFEQNKLMRAALQALGFDATGLLARVVRGFPTDAEPPAGHMVIRVMLDEGPFLVDVGFGNLTPTAPLAERPMVEQATPHETMRLVVVGAELVLQAKLGERWDDLWRLTSNLVLDVDYEVANWFTATHALSPFVGNMIVARPGPDRIRYTFFNGRLNRRLPDGTVDAQDLNDDGCIGAVLAQTFGLALSAEDTRSALDVIERAGRRGVQHRSFT